MWKQSKSREHVSSWPSKKSKILKKKAIERNFRGQKEEGPDTKEKRDKRSRHWQGKA